MKPNQLRLWRGINTAVMFFAMLIPWYYPGLTVEGEIPPNSSTFSLRFQWEFFIRDIMDSAFVRISHGIIDQITIEIILEGVSALLLLLYLAYNLLVLLDRKKEYKTWIAIPAVLMSMVFVFWLWLTTGFPFNWKWRSAEPMLGLWLLSFSLLSSAVLEWVNARQANTIPATPNS